MTTVYVSVAVQLFASVARTVQVDVPALVGVPASRPADVNVRPGGSVPDDTSNVYGAAPPLPLIV
jgi:hypothetical protein